MARHDAQNHNGGLPHVKKNAWGYNVDEVNEFLERTRELYDATDEPKLKQNDVQSASFSLEKGGYVIDSVDQALVRLERAVVDKQNAWELSTQGRVAWRTRTEELAMTLIPRAERPSQQRFKEGEAKAPSYDRKQVDRLVMTSVSTIADDLALPYSPQDKLPKPDDDLSSKKISTIVFTQRTGKNGYDESQVDAYLNRISQVLARIESFARLEGNESFNALEAEERNGGNALNDATSSVSPLIPQNNQNEKSSLASLAAAAGSTTAASSTETRSDAGDMPESFEPAQNSRESFEDVSAGEHSLFSASPQYVNRDRDESTPHGYAVSPSVSSMRDADNQSDSQSINDDAAPVETTPVSFMPTVKQRPHLSADARVVTGNQPVTIYPTGSVTGQNNQNANAANGAANNAADSNPDSNADNVNINDIAMPSFEFKMPDLPLFGVGENTEKNE